MPCQCQDPSVCQGTVRKELVRAALEELVSCHFSVREHPDPEEEARRSHARMAAAWKQALIALGKYPVTTPDDPAAAVSGDVVPVAWTVAGEVTNWARDFSKYRTQHYVRPVYAHPAPAGVPVAQSGGDGVAPSQATSYEGPKRFTPEEVADGNKGIRWVTETHVAGRPTLHDVLDYIERRGDAIDCTCERCTAWKARNAGVGASEISSYDAASLYCWNEQKPAPADGASASEDNFRTAVLRCRYPVCKTIHPSGWGWDTARLNEVIADHAGAEAPAEAQGRAAFDEWARTRMRGILKPESLTMLNGDERTAYYADAATSWAWSAWKESRNAGVAPSQAPSWQAKAMERLAFERGVSAMLDVAVSVIRARHESGYSCDPWKLVEAIRAAKEPTDPCGVSVPAGQSVCKPDADGAPK